MLRLFAISPEKILDIRNALTTIILNADMGLNVDKVIQKQARRIDRLLPKIKYEKEHKCHATE